MVLDGPRTVGTYVGVCRVASLYKLESVCAAEVPATNGFSAECTIVGILVVESSQSQLCLTVFSKASFLFYQIQSRSYYFGG